MSSLSHEVIELSGLAKLVLVEVDLPVLEMI